MSNFPKHKTRLIDCDDATTRLDVASDVRLALRYHKTNVAELLRGGGVRLNSGGWKTQTTKKRINWALDNWGFQDFGVFQKDYEWFVDTPSGTVPFENGMVLRRVDQQQEAA